MKRQTSSEACLCGSGLDYSDCCQPLHQGMPAPDAERLMRSRYSAYALKLEAHLLATWHPDTRPASLDLTEDPAKWVGLEVKSHHALSADSAKVEFVARCKIGGRAQQLHEVSRFVRVDHHWLYLDGDLSPADSV